MYLNRPYISKTALLIISGHLYAKRERERERERETYQHSSTRPRNIEDTVRFMHRN